MLSFEEFPKQKETIASTEGISGVGLQIQLIVFYSYAKIHYYFYIFSLYLFNLISKFVQLKSLTALTETQQDHDRH